MIYGVISNDSTVYVFTLLHDIVFYTIYESVQCMVGYLSDTGSTAY